MELGRVDFMTEFVLGEVWKKLFRVGGGQKDGRTAEVRGCWEGG